MGLPWNYTEFHRNPWISREFHEVPWNSKELHGIPWGYFTRVFFALSVLTRLKVEHVRSISISFSLTYVIGNYNLYHQQGQFLYL